MKHLLAVRKTLLFIPLTLALVFSPFTHGKLPEVQENGQAVQNLPEMLNKTMPAVVNITVMGEVAVKRSIKTDSPIVSKQFQESGSGVILDAKGGYIITNAHVIKNGKVITVKLSDGRRYKAKVTGTDALSDLAILQIDAKDLTEVQLADSDNLQVGDFVAAIGNPFGLQQTVTSGVVSGLHRSDIGIEGYENFIQTDASINPGNSGGALLNMDGQLVGINTALIGPVSGNVGIGLAIPSNMVAQVSKQLISEGEVKRGVLGVMVQNLTPELAEAFNFKGKQGGIVTNVVEGSPAEKAGIKPQDLIEKINNTEIKQGTQVRNIIGLLPVNSKLKIYINRNGKPLTLDATIIDREEYKKATEPASVSLFDGVRLTTYDELAPGFGLVKGVAVLDVDEMSDAWISNLRAHDVILEANGQKVENLNQLMKVAKDKSSNLLLKVGRGTGVIFVVMNTYS
jgi:serine protease Do